MIGSSENRISYNGNGIATEFAYTFKILEKSDIKLLYVAADGTETLLTKDYYVDTEKSVVIYPGYAPGAEIPEAERPPILQEGERLIIYREVPITQQSQLDKHWPFNVIENGLDKLTIICQQIFDKANRSLYASESVSKEFNSKVPIQAGKSFRISDDGLSFEVTEDPAKVIPTAKSLLSDTTKQANVAIENANIAQNAAQSAYDDGKALIEANVQAAANSASAALSSEQSSILNASNASASELNAKNSAEQAKKIVEGIGNPVVDVTEANGVVTVKKSNAAMNSFGLIKTVNDTPPDENGNVNVAGVPIGFEYFSMNPNIPAGSIPLFGGEYSRTTYADLWEWVQTQVGYLLTEEEWQAKASTNEGNVPYYSSGDGSTTFRVPSLKCWVKGANGIEEVGSYLSAGLPNITGSVGTYRLAVESVSTGALYVKWRGTHGQSGSNAANADEIGFDASKSNSIYGNSDTVQPKSIVGMWLVKAYGTVTNVGSTDVASIAVGLTELETRCDAHIRVVETYNNGTNWYRKWSDGWLEQGGRAFNISGGKMFTFIKPFVDVNYTITGAQTGLQDGTHANGSFNIFNKTTTSFYAQDLYAGYYVDWYACGMGA